MAKLEEEGDAFHDELLLAALKAAEDARQSKLQEQKRMQQQWLLGHHKQQQNSQEFLLQSSRKRSSSSQAIILTVNHHMPSAPSVEKGVQPPNNFRVCHPANNFPAGNRGSAPAVHEREQGARMARGRENESPSCAQNQKNVRPRGAYDSPRSGVGSSVGNPGDLQQMEYRGNWGESSSTDRQPLQAIQPWVGSRELEVRRQSPHREVVESGKQSCLVKDKGWFPGREGVAMFRDCQDAAMRILLPSDYTLLHGRRFIKKTGWRKIAFFFNISFEIKDKNIQCDQQSNVIRAEFVIRASMPTGRFTDSQGSCDRNEKKFNRPNHDIPSTAETRAKTRACQDLLGVGDYKADDSF